MQLYLSYPGDTSQLFRENETGFRTTGLTCSFPVNIKFTSSWKAIESKLNKYFGAYNLLI